MEVDNSLLQTQLFKCLTNPIRLKILGVLAVKPYTIKDLSSLLHLKSNRVLHNLGHLIEYGIVKATGDTGTLTFELDKHMLLNFNKENFNSQRDDNDLTIGNADEWKRKVLNTYIEKGQLISIPAKRKYRDIILDWLVNKFEKGTNYSEKQVNEILSQYHADVATLRREFIMTRLMQRENGGGNYWRI